MIEEGIPVPPDKKRALHHRIYPYMDHVVQYANERPGGQEPWIVRDRQAALRNERQGNGRAVVRTWIPSDWSVVNEEDES